MYRFDVRRTDGTLVDTVRRDLPDDAAATVWMGSRGVNQSETIWAYRVHQTAPFARREFGEDAQAVPL